MQFRRNHHICPCTKIFATLTSLFSFLFYICREQKQPLKGGEKYIKLEKTEWNPLSKPSFFPPMSLSSAVFAVWASRKKAFDLLWLWQWSSYCNCLNEHVIGAQMPGSGDYGTPSSGKKNLVQRVTLEQNYILMYQLESPFNKCVILGHGTVNFLFLLHVFILLYLLFSLFVFWLLQRIRKLN